MIRPVTLLAAIALGLLAQPAAAFEDDVDAIARAYVELELGAQLLAPDAADMDTPRREELARARTTRRDAATIGKEARKLVESLDALGPGGDSLTSMRRRFLRARLNTLQLGVRPPDAPKLALVEDLQLRFGFKPRFRELGEYQPALQRLEARIAGPGTLADRITAMKRAATVPPEKVPAVFNAALAECRRRSLSHLDLPPESVDVQFVDDTMVPAQMEYVGGGKSIVRISKSIPADVDNLLRYACHEVYPGHHAQSVNVEDSLYRTRGWPEFGVAIDGETAFPVSESSAEYGVGLAFPTDERIAFQRDVLYPLAGLRMENEQHWRAYLEARTEMLGATATIARDFLEGRIDEQTATGLFVRYRLQTPEAAGQLVKILKAFGSIPIASDLAWYTIDRAMSGQPVAEQWRLLARIQREPMLLDDIAALAPDGNP